MRGPTEFLKDKADRIEATYGRAYDKLVEHVRLFLEEDLSEDDADRNKKHLRDKFIVPRMLRLKRKSVMITDVEGVRLDNYLALSRNKEVAASQVKQFRRLASRAESAPEPIKVEKVEVPSITPEFKEWLATHPDEMKKAFKIAGKTRLCPIREDKEHRGEVRAECEL